MSRRAALRRLVLGLGVLAASTVPTRAAHPPDAELAAFSAVNDLPDSIAAPLWPVMQLGSLAAVPVVAGVMWATGNRSRAKRLLVTGCATWVLAKGVKQVVGRGRPAAVIPNVRIRGDVQSGDGFISGHSAVATALAAGVSPALPAARPVLAGLAATVGFSRIYVGAHLPLDVVGGAALGFVVDAALELVAPTEPRGA